MCPCTHPPPQHGGLQSNIPQPPPFFSVCHVLALCSGVESSFHSQPRSNKSNPNLVGPIIMPNSFLPFNLNVLSVFLEKLLIFAFKNNGITILTSEGDARQSPDKPLIYALNPNGMFQDKAPQVIYISHKSSIVDSSLECNE